MSNVNIKIAMDNRIKPGQITRDEIHAALMARGITVYAADPVYDPITGKLIQTIVNLPKSAAARATQVINANRGVSTTVPVVPVAPPLTLYNADADGAIIFNTFQFAESLADAEGDWQKLILQGQSGLPDSTLPMGIEYRKPTTGMFYESIRTINNDTSTFKYTGLILQNWWYNPDLSPGADIVIPANDISLKINDSTIQLIHGEIALPKPNLEVGALQPGMNELSIVISSEYKLYVFRKVIDNYLVLSYVTYEQAVTAGEI